MKIGILTQPLRNNYGAILQNYALQQVLFGMGHETITFDWEPEGFPMWKRAAYPIVFYILGLLKGKDKVPHYIYQPSTREAKEISRNTKRFVDKYICRIQIPTKGDILRNETIRRGLDAFFVGSDQVWRPRYNDGRLHEMYLSFTSDLPIKRVAYAVSFGTDEWEYSNEETAICKNYASMFDLITVREASGVKLCRDFLGVEAKHVLDPTLLLDKSQYESLVMASNTERSKGTLFHYVLDPSADKEIFINMVASNYGLVPFTVMPKYQKERLSRSVVRNKLEDCVYPGVEKWLRAFMDAKFIICDSFHGCVFSIIFRKPFWVIKNAARGNSRFESLLRMLQLENRLIDINNVNPVPVDDVINWEMVDKQIRGLADLSKALLTEALSKEAYNK